VRVGLFGLGEAGSLIAADLVDAGVAVAAFDPADVATPVGVTRCGRPCEAVAGAEVVVALTQAADAATALDQAFQDLVPGVLYSDWSTAPASLKQALAARAEAGGLAFADVALMAIVPGNGLRLPALCSGSGAARFEARFRPLGMDVAALRGAPAGEAATRKLLRSVMMKGLAATVIEAMRGAQQAGCETWLWDNLAEELRAADGAVLARLVTGTSRHAVRRLHEMEAAAELLADLGVDPVMTAATVESLRRVPAEGVPPVP
jgi:3-hydroxyisobutyrate dehydrogenase-like beta-hydroxyacid dehydrogenase